LATPEGVGRENADGRFSFTSNEITSFMTRKLFDRVRFKMLRMMRKVVYHNYHLRPAGVYQTSADYVRATAHPAARYTPVYPNLISTLPLPRPIFEALTVYSLCDEVSEKNGDPCLVAQITHGVVEIPKGRLYTDNEATVAVMAADNKLIGDVSYQFKWGPLVSPSENALFRQRYFVKPEKYSGVVFTLLTGGGGVDNYFHWIIDVLPRLHLLRQAGLFEKVDWFVVPNYKLSFQKETLDLLGIPPEKIIEGRDQLHLQADVLIASSHPRGLKSHILPDWLIQFYRNAFLPLPSGKKFSPYVYVSRRDSRFRQVTNEEAVMDLLRPYGFEAYELSKLSFLEKKDLFASAKVIVSASGAGLTNMMFSRPGSTLIEFFPEGFVNTHYYNIAQTLGVGYYFLICKSQNRPERVKDAQNEHLNVDLAALKLTLKEAFSQPTTEKTSDFDAA
jgi:hypothetical protein